MSKKQRRQADEEIDKLLSQSVPATGFSPALLPVFAAPAALASLGAACTSLYRCLLLLDEHPISNLKKPSSALTTSLICPMIPTFLFNNSYLTFSSLFSSLSCQLNLETDLFLYFINLCSFYVIKTRCHRISSGFIHCV